VICITISSPETSQIQYTRIPSPIYQYVVNLVVSLTIRGGSGMFMNVPVWGNIMLLTARFFYVAKLTSLTPLSLLSWRRLSCPIVGLKIFSLPIFALSILVTFSYDISGSDRTPALIPHKTIFWLITLFLTRCMHIYNNNITPATSQQYIWQPIANKLYSLHCWYYSTVYKKPVPIWWFSFPFP